MGSQATSVNLWKDLEGRTIKPQVSLSPSRWVATEVLLSRHQTPAIASAWQTVFDSQSFHIWAASITHSYNTDVPKRQAEEGPVPRPSGIDGAECMLYKDP